MPSILQPTEDAIRRAADAIRGGGLVAFPTETVYGLGANARDPAAVAKVFEAKDRPAFDPLIVHVPSAEAARSVVKEWPETAERLAAAFWPGPLTLVLPKRPEVPDLVTSGLGTVGVRVPQHPVALALLQAAGTPIAAPSANRFGAISPTRAEHVASEFGDSAGAGGELVDLILDGGPCETGVESTVVSLVRDQKVCVLRLGGTPIEALRGVVGEVELASPGSPLASPGMLKRHYAPRTPLKVVDRLGDEAVEAGPRVGVLGFRSIPEPSRTAAAAGEVLSANGDLREAAANLFASLRRLDAAGVDVIVAERAPDRGLGRAINDRLARAAHG